MGYPNQTVGFIMWFLTLLFGMLLGHLVSQWASYKSFPFRMINQMAMTAVDVKGKRLWRWMCCHKKPAHDRPDPTTGRSPITSSDHPAQLQLPPLDQLLSMVQTLSQTASMFSTRNGTHVATHTTPHVAAHTTPHVATHTAQRRTHHNSAFHRKPLRKPSSYLLSEVNPMSINKQL